ncbi:MAG: 1,4-alpha-glucan branching protein, partial [Bacteroidetes bacterium]
MAQLFPSVAWSRQANIYEVNIRQYTKEGTFEAFAKHLPRLKAMGIDVLWFMPITPISKKIRQGTLGSYYACSSYTKINEEFGTLESFQQLVKQAHDVGLRVIIDWVANHTGWDHEWTVTNPEYYKRNAEGEFFDANGWHDVIDVDYDNPALQQAMVQAMQYWITQCDVDGFRCDMAHLVPLEFWKKARTALQATKHCYWLAETDVHSYFDVFDTLYGWEWMHASEKIVKGEFSLQQYNSLLHYYRTQGSKGAKLLFTTNHDENSWNGTEFEKYGTYAQAMAVFSVLFPGNALVYSGQEIPNKKRLAFFDKDELN